MSDPQAGSTTSRYEVLARLSQGSGTAELFAARATGVDRLVVIKRLRREAAKEKAVAQAFLAEARVAAKLAHPNVAQVFEVGKLGGAYFFTTEYVDGETIRALVAHARGKKIQVPIRAFLTIAAGAAAGLHHAHERNGMDGKSLNIIHGDISPTNVMISREGIVKVLDFGMSRGRNPTKLAYASPEQLRSEKLDRRSDLFSLGVVLWELLTLGELFERPTDDETRAAIENDEAPAPSLRRFDVPPELDAMLIKLIAKKPEARFQTCGELLAAIDSLSTKLGFSLSTNDLARMMRLWFGPPSAAAEGDELKPIEVASEDILAEPPAGPHPVDEQLTTVGEAAATIRAMAQRMGGSARSDRPATTPPSVGEVEDARENFAQIRDRILEQARKRKTTKAPPLSGQADTPPSGVPAAIAAADSAAAPTRKKPETLNSANNAYAFITKVAETATAPQAKATAADAGMALKALQATSAHADPGGNGTSISPTSRAVTATYDAIAAAAAAEEIAKAAERAEAALATSEPLASTEETKGAQGTIEATSSSESSERAPVAKIELSKSAAADVKVSADAKSEAKIDAKSEAKVDAKVDAKSDAKSEAKIDAKAEKADAKPDKKASDAKSAKAANDEKPSNKGAKTNGVAARASTSEDKATSSASRAARSTSEADDVPAPSGRPSWLMPVLLVAAAAVILIFVMKGRSHQTKKPDQVAQNQGGAGAGAGAGTSNAGTTKSGSGANTGTTTGSAVAMTGSDTGATTGSAMQQGSATTMVTPVDAAVVAAPVDAAIVAEVKPDAAVVATNTGTKTNTGTTGTTDNGTKTNTTDNGTKTNTGTTGTKTNTGTGTKTNTGTTGTGTKTNTGTTGTKTEPAAEETIEDLFAKGDFAKTNKACVKNLIFSPERLQDCALSACHASNPALAKRWVNAIAKAARPDIVAQCKTLGLDLEAGQPPAP